LAHAVLEAMMKATIHLAAALAATAALGGSSGAAEAAPELQLQRVLYSSGGVGYFEYEAKVSGNAQLSLPVRLDQVNDVLKSIVVFDDRGNLGEVSLPGKERASEALRELPFDESALASPWALLEALRGAVVRAESAGRTVEGRIVAVTEEQTRLPGNETITRHRLTLAHEGGIDQLIVEDLQGLKVVDEALQKQIDAALAALAGERDRDRRALDIRVNGEGDRLVRVAYVVEVPLWKSTYRLILSGENDAKTADLQGFAVVENRSGQAWSNVDLTLVSGNPVTFRQAIYDTYYVNRPEVPVEVLGRVLPRPDTGGMTAADHAMEAAMAPPSPAFGFGRPKSLRARAMKPAAITPAAGSEEASQVVFHLAQPVSLPSGQSALLPVLSRALPAERVSLYQPDVEARHPLSSVELTNDGDTDLPPGVMALYETARGGGEPTYAGDAQLSLLPVGASRFVSYAVDLRVTVDRAEQGSTTITVAKIVDGALQLTRTEQRTTTYTIAGAAREPRTVVLEEPRLPGFTLKPSRGIDRFETTESHYRLWRSVAAGETVKVTSVQERSLLESVGIADLDSDKLGAFASSQDLPAPVREALGEIVALRAVVAAKEAAKKDLAAERTRIVDDQARLRDNLKAVPAGSDLHKRYLTQLSADEDRLQALQGEIAAADAAIAQARKALADRIRALRID
jgi:Domain of unknown function (DUF4139)